LEKLVYGPLKQSMRRGGKQAGRGKGGEGEVREIATVRLSLREKLKTVMRAMLVPGPKIRRSWARYSKKSADFDEPIYPGKILEKPINRLVFIVDASGSVFDLFPLFLGAILDIMKVYDPEVKIVVFSDGIEYVLPSRDPRKWFTIGEVRQIVANPDRLRRIVKYTGGGTDLTEAMQYALELLDASRADGFGVVILSDFDAYYDNEVARKFGERLGSRCLAIYDAEVGAVMSTIRDIGCRYVEAVTREDLAEMRREYSRFVQASTEGKKLDAGYRLNEV